MADNRDALLRSARSSLPRPRRLRLALVMSALAVLSLTAASSSQCGGGGGGSCQKCRDDCAREGVPPSQCNCEGCTNP